MSLIAHAPVLAVAIPLLAAFAIPLAGLFGGKARNAVALLGVFGAMLAVAAVGSQVMSGGHLAYMVGSAGVLLPSGYHVPIRIALEADFLSVIVAMIASIAAFIGVVCSESLFKKGERGIVGHHSLMLVALAGMVGLSFAGDLFNIFVFLEIVSVASCGLIAFRRGGGPAEAGFKYLVVSSVAGIFVLVSSAIMYGQYNSLNLAALAGMMELTMLDGIALALLFGGLAMKAGSVPMHMWVPDAYSEARAPVAVILVASTIVSAYVLFRVCFSLFGGAAAGWMLIALGVLSMFVGVTMAVMQKDIMRLIAYHSISQVGYILLGAGVGLAAVSAHGFAALSGGIFHMMNYFLYKSLLFLAAGAVVHRLGSRRLDDMGGLAHKMPLTTAFFVLGALAISGIPPLSGFASKLAIYESVAMFNPLLSAVAMVVSVLTLASFVKVFQGVFMGPSLPKNRNVREVSGGLVVGMAVLAGMILVLSLFPEIGLEGFAEPAARALLDRSGYIAAVMGGAT